MRLHTDLILERHIRDAAKRWAGVGIIRLDRHGSRKRDHAYEVQLSGNGVTGGMHGNHGYRMATWDEWGMVLAALYRIDTELIAGPYPHNHEGEYESFDWSTGDRYQWLTPAQQHLRHRFDTVRIVHTYGLIPGMVGCYQEQECRCAAVRRFVLDRVQGTSVTEHWPGVGEVAIHTPERN